MLHTTHSLTSQQPPSSAYRSPVMRAEYPTPVRTQKLGNAARPRAESSRPAWLLFTAGTVLDDDVRDGLINGVWTRASFNQTTGPFPDAYDSATGAIQGGPNANAG